VVGWGLDLTVTQPTLMSLVGAPAIASPPWVPANAPDGDGLAGIASLAPPINGSVSGNNVALATLHFTAKLVGDTDLVLSTTPGDLTEGFALDPSGFDTVTFQAGHVTVVPEPATVLCLASGLLLTLRRRRQVLMELKQDS